MKKYKQPRINGPIQGFATGGEQVTSISYTGFRSRQSKLLAGQNGVRKREPMYVGTNLITPAQNNGNWTQLTGLTSTGLGAANGSAYIHRFTVNNYKEEIYMLGCKNSSLNTSATCAYTKHNNATVWTGIANHPAPDFGYAWCLDDGTIFTASSANYRYSPVSNTWSSSLGAGPSISSSFFIHPSFLWKGRMYGLLGSNSTVFRYDPPASTTTIATIPINNSLADVRCIQVNDLVIITHLGTGVAGLKVYFFSLELEKLVHITLCSSDILLSNDYLYLRGGPLLLDGSNLLIGGLLNINLNTGLLGFSTYNQLIWSPGIAQNITVMYGSQTYIIGNSGHQFAQIATFNNTSYAATWWLWKNSVINSINH